MTLISMTGFADLAGTAEALSWVWEARSVNGRGLDLRLRLPEGFEALEAPLRATLPRALHRGSVTIGLRIGRGGGAEARPRLNLAALEAAIEAAEIAGDLAARRGLGLAPMTAADLLTLRCVIDTDAPNLSENAALMRALEADRKSVV